MNLCVLIPAYNEALHIEGAIRSVLDQAASCPVQIIVVDDGSTDDTAAIVTRLKRDYPTIRLIKTANRGIPYTRNTLVENIPDTCDYVTFLDADDAFAPGRIERHFLLFASDPTLDFVFGQLRLVNAEAGGLSGAITDDDTIARGPSLSAGTYAKSLIRRIGSFDPEFRQSEDMDYLFRIIESGAQCFLLDEVATFYRRHKGNITANISQTRRYFMKAMLWHRRRRAQDTTLASVEGVFYVAHLASDLQAARR